MNRFVRYVAPVVSRVYQQSPAPRTVLALQVKFDRVVIRVEQQQDVIVPQWLPMRVAFAEGVPGQQHADATRKVLVPFDDGHLGAGWRQPRHVLPGCTLQRASLKETATAEHRV